MVKPGRKRLNIEEMRVPVACQTLAHNRTDFLFPLLQYRGLNLKDALANAYFQGIADCVETIESRGGDLYAIVHPQPAPQPITADNEIT